MRRPRWLRWVGLWLAGWRDPFAGWPRSSNPKVQDEYGLRYIRERHEHYKQHPEDMKPLP
jgi:hypothetical protein